MKTEKRVSISAFVNPEDHERLVELARAEERSVSALLRLAIREYLSRRAVEEAPLPATASVANNGANQSARFLTGTSAVTPP